MEENTLTKNTSWSSKKNPPNNRQNIFLNVIAAAIISLSVASVSENSLLIQLVESNIHLDSHYQELKGDNVNLQELYNELLDQCQVLDSYGNLTVEEAKNLIKTKPDSILVDVRYDHEHISSHIAESINIYVICHPEELEKLDLTTKILVYCRTGVRSLRALKILRESGHYKVYNMFGGLKLG